MGIIKKVIPLYKTVKHPIVLSRNKVFFIIQISFQATLNLWCAPQCYQIISGYTQKYDIISVINALNPFTYY